MPIPIPLILAGITAASSIAQSWMNKRAMEKTNAAALANQQKMYAQERQDNLSQWHLQNEFNSPTSQMARLRQAKLNPMLMYGSGSPGGQAAPMPNVSAPSWNPSAPQHSFAGGIGAGLQNYYEFNQREAQTDQVKAATTVSEMQAGLIAAQTANESIKGSRNAFELKQAERLKDISVDYAAARLRNTQLQGELALNEDERRSLLVNKSLKQASEDILNTRMARAKTATEIRHIKAMIDSTEIQTQIAGYEAKLRADGINPGDPTWLRMAAQFLGKLLGGSVLDPNFIKSKF